MKRLKSLIGLVAVGLLLCMAMPATAGDDIYGQGTIKRNGVGVANKQVTIKFVYYSAGLTLRQHQETVTTDGSGNFFVLFETIYDVDRGNVHFQQIMGVQGYDNGNYYCDPTARGSQYMYDDVYYWDTVNIYDLP